MMAVRLRSLAFECVRFPLTIAFSFIALWTFPFGPRTRYQIITTWSKLIIILVRVICGMRYRVIGRENIPQEASIVLSKHQSAWETIAFQQIFPPQVWVLKKILLKIPFFGWGLAMMNPIAIDRGAGVRALRQTLEQGSKRILDGWWIVIFPEGTRMAPGKRGRYHVGGAWLAAQLGAKVVPIAHNAGTVWARKAFLKYPGTITVSIGPAIDATGRKPEELMKGVEDWIEQEVERIGSARHS
ncbi:MAG: 1-acyl-sn-glycerol-3-phosphate acyltransferase [Betaproteobacteria bacterium]|jgi:1-acyl-sn-glycerol-3-phosphate acyltransferase|nr:MAG: 1-acyl-sn-glycerol-3-phosphate acyltransferase [Betaproteobacteria bacterium]